MQVGDAMGATGQRTLQFVANLGPLTGSCTLPAAEAGIPYSGACTPRLGLPPYSCALGTGTLPAGLAVNADCTITGTPTTGGTSTFSVRVADSGNSAVSPSASI